MSGGHWRGSISKGDVNIWQKKPEKKGIEDVEGYVRLVIEAEDGLFDLDDMPVDL